MGSLQQQATALLDRVAHTKGFVIEAAGTGVKVVNVDSRDSVKIRLATPKPNILPSIKTRLRRIGWTEELYKEQQAKDREQRMARANDDYEKQYATALANAQTAVKEVQPAAMPGGVTMTPEVVTPERAFEYLDASEKAAGTNGQRQRRLSKKQVTSYAEAMKRGEWLLTHQGIAITQDGWVHDGQHRLHACIEANIPVPLVVWRGVDPNTFRAVDTGKRRSIGDMMEIEGETHGTLLGSTLRIVYLWDLHVHEGVPQSQWDSVETSPDMLLDVLDQHPTVRESVVVGNRLKNIKLSPTAATSAHFIIRQAWPDAPVDEWYSQLRSGAIGDPAAPALTLRNFLLGQGKRRTTYDPGRMPPKRIFHLYLLMRAWNATCEGRSMKNVSWKLPLEIPAPYAPRT